MFNDDLEIDENEPPVIEEEQGQKQEQETQSQIAKKEFSDEEKEEYGKKVKRRIDKLTAEIYQERQVKEQQARELAELKAWRQEQERKHDDTAIAAELDRLRKERLDAVTVDDFETINAIDEKIIDLKLRGKEKQAPEPKVERVPDTQAPSIPEAQQAWLEQNDWYYSPLKQQQAQQANQAYLQLLQEGYDANDEETYTELDKRLNGGKPRPQAKRNPPPSSGVDRGANAGGSVKGSFSDRDIQLMREFNLDPNNEIHRAEWLKNKRA